MSLDLYVPKSFPIVAYILDGYSDSRFNICMNKLMPTQ